MSSIIYISYVRVAALLAASLLAPSALASSSMSSASATHKCATYQDNICMYLSVTGHPGMPKQHSDNGAVKISAKEKLNIAIYVYPLVTKVNLSITDGAGKVIETKVMDSQFIAQHYANIPLGGGRLQSGTRGARPCLTHGSRACIR